MTVLTSHVSVANSLNKHRPVALPGQMGVQEPACSNAIRDFCMSVSQCVTEIAEVQAFSMIKLQLMKSSVLQRPKASGRNKPQLPNHLKRWHKMVYASQKLGKDDTAFKRIILSHKVLLTCYQQGFVLSCDVLEQAATVIRLSIDHKKLR